jgi:N-acetyl-beta-hexosaminidase
LKMY